MEYFMIMKSQKIKLFLIILKFINAQQVSVLEHETEMGRHNSIVQVDSDTYALAYSDENEKGWIATFTISSDGNTITEVASLKHDNNQGIYNSLVQVDSDTYLLAYTGNNDDGFIVTFTISSDGTTITEVTQLEHQTSDAKYNSLVQVDSDTYALAYAGPNDDGFITTFTVSSNGSSISEVTTLEHNTNQGTYNSLVQVDSDTYALAYAGDGDDGYISTFTISSNGSSITEVDELEHMIANGMDNSLIQVDSDTYALAYRGKMGDGFITTFTISSSGSSITEVASYEYDISDASYNSLAKVDSDTYVLAYSGPDEDGYISSFTISSNGGSITEIQEIEHDTDKGRHNSLIQIDSDTYVLAYEGLNSDGFIKTFSVSTDGALPVEITSFEIVSATSNGIILQWVTESEINNLGFILERKTANAGWIEIASYINNTNLQGQGSTSNHNTYIHTDESIVWNELYDYRIADVDYDGNIKYYEQELTGLSISSDFPNSYLLNQNFPNPFNPITEFSYYIPMENQLTISIYDIRGRIVRNLFNDKQISGSHRISWDGKNENGNYVPTGFYFCTLEAGDVIMTRKMALLK
tara:strand:+ start:4676 stop:6424 length:1749 start_codon:yes stop_codon:yes gene_type:complete